MKKYILMIVMLVITGFLFQAGTLELKAQFGKNKVQYREFDWKYIESEHFQAYYDNGSKYLAEFGIIEAEKALTSIQGLLNFTITKKIVLFIYDSHNDFQQTNIIHSYMSEGVGGVTELLKNRVVLPFQGDYAQFRHVVHHELVHAIINDMFFGGSFQTALRFGGRSLPIWVNEGLAEFESIGGMNVETDTYMRDLAISEMFPSLTEMTDYLAYRGGQTFFSYVADKYGKDKITEFMNYLSIYKDLDPAFKSTFNLSVEDFSEEFLKECKKNFLPDLKVYEDPTDYATRITDRKLLNNFFNSSPAISPDGEKMAYISDRDGFFSIYVTGFSKNDKPKTIVSSFKQKDFEQLNILTPGISWDPTGKKLAISAKSGGEDAVFIVDVNSGDYEKFMFGFNSISSAQWSPDGKYIAFVGVIKEQNDVYIMDVTTKKIQNITNDVFSDAIPFWTPDSKSIYFISNRKDVISKNLKASDFKMWNHDFNSSDIYKADINSGDIVRITNDPDNKKTSIAVTADGKYLLYVSNKNGIGNVYRLEVATGKTQAVTNSLTSIIQISLAKDNSKLLFSTQVKAGYDIFLLKNPLEKLKDGDLPLTNFKSKLNKKDIVTQALLTAIDSSSKLNSIKENLSYGKFVVDFSKQQFVEINNDAVKNAETQTLTKQKINDDFVEKEPQTVFSRDMFQLDPQYNAYYGISYTAVGLFSDILGDNQIYAQANLLNDLKNSQFYFAYNYLPKVFDYQFSVYLNSVTLSPIAYQDQSGNVITENNNYSSYGFDVSALYAFDMFSRLEFGAGIANGSKTTTYSGVDIPENYSSRTIFTLSTTYVYDNSMGGGWAPLMGSRAYVSALFSPKFSNSSLGFFTLKMDYRKYFHIWDNISFAMRGSAGASFGPNPQIFNVGGVDGWLASQSDIYKNITTTFENPEDFMFLNNFETPVRGWKIGELRNSKFFVANFELRFPIFRAIIAGPLPILFQSLMGNLFFDVGGAWDKSFVISQHDDFGNTLPVNMIYSTGVGLRSVVFGIPMKMDVAWIYDYIGWAQPAYIFSWGLDF